MWYCSPKWSLLIHGLFLTFLISPSNKPAQYLRTLNIKLTSLLDAIKLIPNCVPLIGKEQSTLKATFNCFCTPLFFSSLFLISAIHFCFMSCLGSLRFNAYLALLFSFNFLQFFLQYVPFLVLILF